MNKQLGVAKQLVKLSGAWSNVYIIGNTRLSTFRFWSVDTKNRSGRSTITEVDTNEWAKGVTWIVGVMTVDGAQAELKIPTESWNPRTSKLRSRTQKAE